jgi:hypothetical protein
VGQSVQARKGSQKEAEHKGRRRYDQPEPSEHRRERREPIEVGKIPPYPQHDRRDLPNLGHGKPAPFELLPHHIVEVDFLLVAVLVEELGRLDFENALSPTDFLQSHELENAASKIKKGRDHRSVMGFLAAAIRENTAAKARKIAVSHATAPSSRVSVQRPPMSDE